jgi:hypothetical protein
MHSVSIELTAFIVSSKTPGRKQVPNEKLIKRLSLIVKRADKKIGADKVMNTKSSLQEKISTVQAGSFISAHPSFPEHTDLGTSSRLLARIHPH